MATSVVAKSKFKEYKEAGKPLPAGWALDVDGKPTTDPDEGMKGLVLPMAGFKGYGIAMLIDILSGLVSGASFLDKVGRFYTEDNACMKTAGLFTNQRPIVLIIDDQEDIRTLIKDVLGEEYEQIINEYVASVRNSEKSGNDPICMPGDDRLAFYKSGE